jgi:tetratricopeptide (TPR) repeat protein
VVYRQNFKDARPYEREFAGIQSYEPISRSNEGLIDVLQIGRNDAEGYFYYVMELADPAEVAPVTPEFGDTQRDKSIGTGLGEKKPGELYPGSYVPKTLSRVIQQRGRLTYEECLTLGLTLNLALGHLHRHGLIHRDVKPSNIIFVNDVPKLTDIGLVTDVAGAESFVGTEGFIPPEGPNSPQADLYALGKVLYEASMGKDRHQFPEPLTAIGLDPDSQALMELNAVLVRACAPDPKARYRRAEEMNADLALLHNGESVRNKHAMARRLKWMTRIGALTMGVIVLAVIPYYLALREARRATASAKLEAQQRQRAQIEATKSQVVAQFLKDMVKGAEPSIALGRDTTLLKEILDQTAERIGRDLMDQPEVEAELCNTLGEIYQELGQYGAAERMLRRALELRLALSGEENLAVAQTLSDLSPALWNQGNLKEAENLQRRALEIRTKLAGGNDAAVAESLQDLGCILSGETKLAEAEATFRRALDIRRKALGPEHIEVAQSLSGVANMLSAQGQWQAAEELFREIVEMTRKLLGPGHPKFAGALNGLVLALLPQGKLKEAEANIRQALQIQMEVLGPDHPLVAESLTRLARVLRSTGNLAEAKTRLEQALAIWSKRFSDQNPGIGETLSALVDIFLSEGNQAELERVFREISRTAFTGARPNTGLLRACGTYHARTGQWALAAFDFAKIVQLEPVNHEAVHCLAAVRIQSRDWEGYYRLCQQIIAQFGTVTNDPRVADRMAKDCLICPAKDADLSIPAKLANVAVTFDERSAAAPWFQFCKGLAEYRLGKYQAAEEWQRKVLQKVEQGSIRDVGAYMVLALAQYRLQREDEARETFAAGLRLATRRLPEPSAGDLGDGWMDWVFARALIREARAQFESLEHEE